MYINICVKHTFDIVYVANAKFSLLKLLIYEPYYLCLSRLECQA